VLAAVGGPRRPAVHDLPALIVAATGTGLREPWPGELGRAIDGSRTIHDRLGGCGWGGGSQDTARNHHRRVCPHNIGKAETTPTRPPCADPAPCLRRTPDISVAIAPAVRCCFSVLPVGCWRGARPLPTAVSCSPAGCIPRCQPPPPWSANWKRRGSRTTSFSGSPVSSAASPSWLSPLRHGGCRRGVTHRTRSPRHPRRQVTIPSQPGTRNPALLLCLHRYR